MSTWFPYKFRCIEVRGDIMKVEGAKWPAWTDKEGDAFIKDFFDWLTARGLRFGGTFGPRSPGEISRRRSECPMLWDGLHVDKAFLMDTLKEIMTDAMMGMGNEARALKQIRVRVRAILDESD